MWCQVRFSVPLGRERQALPAQVRRNASPGVPLSDRPGGWKRMFRNLPSAGVSCPSVSRPTAWCCAGRSPTTSTRSMARSSTRSSTPASPPGAHRERFVGRATISYDFGVFDQRDGAIVEMAGVREQLGPAVVEIGYRSRLELPRVLLVCRAWTASISTATRPIPAAPPSPSGSAPASTAPRSTEPGHRRSAAGDGGPDQGALPLTRRQASRLQRSMRLGGSARHCRDDRARAHVGPFRLDEFGAFLSAVLALDLSPGCGSPDMGRSERMPTFVVREDDTAAVCVPERTGSLSVSQGYWR